MQDRPTAPELLAAAREFLEGELAPAVGDAQLRYRLLIAAHALATVERELADEGARLGAELAALDALLGRPPAAPPADLSQLRQRVLDVNGELCERIRRGDADAGAWRDQVVAHLEAAVTDKLRVNNPALLALLLAERGEASGS